MPGRGGTDIRAPFVYANAQLQEGERLAGIVVATDGYGPLPTAEPRVPVIWLLPAREAAAFRPPFGGVIAINAPDGSAWDGRH
jgi:predicted metal-dependent peptidase